MKTIRAGIIGLGNIGKGVFDLLEKNRDLIASRTGVKIEITSICDTRAGVLAEIPSAVRKTGDWHEVVSAPDTDTVIELIGGLSPAADIVLTALKAGKNVVTANKKLLAEKGREIFSAAAEATGFLKFEAAVGGGIPCLLALNTGMAANRIKSIIGILNGTTNYILSQMEEKGLSFELALKEAQKKGFAEADPTFDIEGYDAGHKISLLAMLAYGRIMDYSRLNIEGITRISDMDIKYAREMGYVIKLLGIAKMTDGLMDISVHPTMLPELHPLASVRNEVNAVMIDGDMTAPITLFGKGAGPFPTASAVISDIIQIAEEKAPRYPWYVNGPEPEFITPEKRISRYYIRMHTKDEPGILSRISGILGNFSISIASLIQRANTGSFVPLIMMTHAVSEDSMLKAEAEINRSDFIKGKTVIIRVED